MSDPTSPIPRQSDPRRPRVSVIVPVYNRSRELRRLLSALAHQTFGPSDMEVLICDDGSTENVSAAVEEFKEQSGSPVIHLRQSNQGAGTARNLGLAHARGEIVAFTDSDCEPDPSWLAELVRPFEDPRVGIVGGLIDYRSTQHLSGRCVNFLMSSMLGAGGARDPRATVHMKYYPRAGNLAVRRELAEKVSGFPTPPHGEDLEFSHKVLQLGVRGKFVPSAKVLHHERRTLAEVAREAFKKGAARVRLARRHGMHELIHTLPALLCLYLLLFCAICVVRPDLVLWSAVPACLYVALLGILLLQGMFAIGDVRAGLLTPLYALLMHVGYGLGYLCAWCNALLFSHLPGPAQRKPGSCDCPAPEQGVNRAGTDQAPAQVVREQPRR